MKLNGLLLSFINTMFSELQNIWTDEDELARNFDVDKEDKADEENDVTRAQSARDAVNGNRILTPDEFCSSNS